MKSRLINVVLGLAALVAIMVAMGAPSMNW
jgi:hypothetical protein